MIVVKPIGLKIWRIKTNIAANEGAKTNWAQNSSAENKRAQTNRVESS